MNEGIHLDLDTWIVPGQIRKANLCRGLGNRYTPAGTEVLISRSSQHPEVLISRSSQHPTAIPGGAECHNCEHPQLRCSMHCPEAYTTSTGTTTDK